MATYVYCRETGRMVDKVTREPMNPQDGPVGMPMTFGDTPGYRSPIDGRWIEGRRARQYDLQSNGCVEAGDMPSKPRGFRNAKFAAKHGVSHLLNGD
jgi:hypothetical protein